MKEHALAYAAAGFPVLWIYGIQKDVETGELVCTCPHPGTDNCNPGKHAPFLSDIRERERTGKTTGGSTGHGAKDATTDPAIIETFPWDEGCNFGIAGRDTFPIIDIDDPEIVAKLLDPEVGLRDIAVVATSGRGLHCYCQAAPTKNGVLYRADTGEKIGEIRAQGWYVAGAPSLHYSGRRYQWLGQSVVDDVPVTQGTGWDYAAEIMALAGIEIKKKSETGPHVPRSDAIVNNELSFTTSNATLLSMMLPTYPTSDRSSDLFRLGCELVREVKVQGLDIDRHVLAGCVKKADLIRQHPRGPKYAFRENADDYYWDLILSAEASVVSDAEKETADDGVEEVQDHGSFYYVEEPPQFIDNRNPKHPKKICDFEFKLVDRLRTFADEESTTYVEQRVYRARQRLEEHDVMLGPKDYKSTRSWLEAVHERMPLPPHFIVEERMGETFKNAVHYVSGRVPESDAYGFSGWLRHRDAFLLPGAPGLITAEGFDESIRYALPPDESASFLQYGWNVVPKEYPLEATFRALYALREPQIMVPLITQVLAAPMQSILKDDAVTVLHLFAKTGSYKTTIARLALSLYGKFWSIQHEIDEWKLTKAALEYKLNLARDLPILVDDFKLIGLSPTAFADRITLIQNYGDGTAKGRMTREMKAGKRYTPQALMISTGEDVWDGQESAAARTLVIDASLSPGAERENELKRRITRLQHMAEEGLLGAIGYEWIQWLMTKGRVYIAHEIDKRWREKRVRLETWEAHPRVLSSIGMLLSVSSLFQEFLAEKAPEFAEEYRKIQAEGWTKVLGSAVERAKTARGFSPYETLSTAMREALTTSDGYLQQRTADADGVGVQGADPIGFVDQHFVWLNEGVTLGWYQERMRRRGVDSHIGWSALRQEALSIPGATKKEEGVYIYGGSKLRMIGIPRAHFFGDDDPGATTYTTSDTPEKTAAEDE